MGSPRGTAASSGCLLRGEYGFQGAMMSDDLDATLQATGSDPGTVALRALRPAMTCSTSPARRPTTQLRRGSLKSCSN